jgi:hypothetical protein
VVIWTNPGGSNPERQLTATILTPLVSGARSLKPTEAGSLNTAPNGRLRSRGIWQRKQDRSISFAPEDVSDIEWVFTARADGTTFVSITNSGFSGNARDGKPCGWRYRGLFRLCWRGQRRC